MKIDDLLPKIYKDLSKRGYTNERNFISFDDVNQNYLWFINLTWVPNEEIMQKEYESFHNLKMIPFAYTNGGDYWCFDLNQKDYIPIVCCYHDGAEGEYFAKTLEAALFRQILDFACNEFTDSEIEDDQSVVTGKKIILNWIRRLEEYFPNEWISELNNIVNNKDYVDSSPGYVVMISESKYDELVKKYIDFDLLDKKFIWTQEDTTKFFGGATSTE
ncbi:hypothetical protein BBR47_12770 [Brevibacillus brevis NBRC 100599]|uniref:Knr4/Smi1-like domain-containing protein n=1 Tax=Brevibacillus brevis (strain 47 / JCM 6285 / NBRC 100599) TaxID=358681 RepID=C0Z7L1_BREBN|nr:MULTISPECIES: SMI1/KNR4 family protein [Bacillales]TQR38695.1 SMI1/KNR4 family protein [Lysinibacillus sp. SDF0063]BAH42254.1 hypothetical protein BBR47_12770 [Brevibacillus brevis NBRC 100599]